MAGLSKREHEVLEMLLTSADDKVAAANLRISVGQVRQHKTRAKRKIAAAEKFLRDMKRYKDILYPSKRYKDI